MVWGLRTQPSKATRQTPFFLTYGLEAILPADIMWKSPRVEAYQEGEADEARQLELDIVEEARINALTQSARYLQGVRRYQDQFGGGGARSGTGGGRFGSSGARFVGG